MRPIKRKQVSAIVAEKLNLSSDTVDEIVSCYYKIVQKKLSTLEHERIVVNRLGTFYIKRNKLEEKLDIYSKSLAKYEAIEEPNMTQYNSLITLRADVANFKAMLAKLDGITEKQKIKQEEKLTYKNNKNG